MTDPEDAVIAAIRKHPRLKTLDDYEAALSEMESYLVKPSPRGTPAGDLLFALIAEIATYEATYFSLENNPGLMSVH